MNVVLNTGRPRVAVGHDGGMTQTERTQSIIFALGMLVAAGPTLQSERERCLLSPTS